MKYKRVVERYTTSHEQFTRVPFGSPPGKGQEPLTVTMIEVEDNHQPLLNDPCCSKPLDTSFIPLNSMAIYPKCDHTR